MLVSLLEVDRYLRNNAKIFNSFLFYREASSDISSRREDASHGFDTW